MRRRRNLLRVVLPAPIAALALTAALASACRSTAEPAPPTRDCSVTVWHHAASDAAHVEVVTSWSGWARPGVVLAPQRADGWRVTRLEPPPGEQEYAIVDDGTWLTDPNVGTTAFHGDDEVTWVDVADCAVPALRVDDAHGSADGGGAIAATFLAARDAAPLDPATIVVVDRAGGSVPFTKTTDAARGALTIALDALPPGKHTLTIRAKDRRGRDAEEANATIWIEPAPRDARDLVLYQVIVDRYRDGDGRPLAAPQPASARAGGRLDGVRRAIESGELAALGVNALWLSPLYTNPDGAFPGDGGRTFTGYHGYWPIASRAIDPRLGDEAAVDALVAAAHARGMRVLFDVVPNHVHQEHPYVAAHAHDWFNHPDGSCICGHGACDWASHIQDCWFAPYLPDLDWRNADVADQITSDVRWWLDRFDGDGIRIDAVPMMPRAATRRIAAAIRAAHDHPGHRSFLLGENFTGPGGYALLRYQLGPFGLDSEFHFPLMWALRAAVAEESAPLADVDAAIHAGEEAWGGAGAVMATMIGNHDVARFASVAMADGGGDPWTPAVQPPDDSDVYAKQLLALGAVLTLPGAPVVYYGDEIALVGHADPDSRRVMPDEASLTAAQRATRDGVKRLAAARACSPALRRGGYRTLFADAEHLVFARELDGADPAVIVLERRGTSPLAVPLPGVPDGAWVDAVSRASTSLRAELTNLPAAPLSVRLFFPKGSACADAQR